MPKNAANFMKGLGTGMVAGATVMVVGKMMLKDRKKMEKAVGFKGVCRRIFHVLMFPFFDVIGQWTTYIAVFKKIEWKPIPHDTVMDISKLQAEDEAQTVEERLEEETQLENA